MVSFFKTKNECIEGTNKCTFNHNAEYALVICMCIPTDFGKINK